MTEGIILAIIAAVPALFGGLLVAWWTGRQKLKETQAQLNREGQSIEYQEMQQEVKQLRADHGAMRAELTAYHTENITLREQNADMRRTIMDHQELIEDFVAYQVEHQMWLDAGSVGPQPQMTWRMVEKIRRIRDKQNGPAESQNLPPVVKPTPDDAVDNQN